MAANNIIKGDDLMLFDKDGHSIAWATSHTLTMTSATVDVANKDYGFWGAQEVGKLSWEITSENLYSDTGYEYLFDVMTSREAVDIYFGHTQEGDGHGSLEEEDVEFWSKNSSKYYKGKAMITSLTLNANTGENATFSCTLTGIGSLAKTPASTPGQGGAGTGG